MNKGLVAAVIAAGMLVVAGTLAQADEEYDKNLPVVAKELPKATVSLEQGIKAAEREGMPISAQYEYEDGHLQLSVFTSKNQDRLEIIVDYKTGAIKTVQNITDPDDIKEAKKQIKTMNKASVPLDQAVAEAVKANAGYQAVQILPKLSGGHPIATITLLKGSDVKKVTEKLD